MPTRLQLIINRLIGSVGIIGLLFYSLTDFASAEDLTLHESGFVVTQLPDGVGAKQVECSPGGVWGDFVYIADSGGNAVERIDPGNVVSIFASGGGLSFPAGLAFGPGPGANFGNFLYVTNFSNSTISKIDPSGVESLFANLPAPGGNAFDPLGVYGTEMFVSTAFAGPIYKVDNTGASAVFSTLESTYLKFGPGAAWGNGLYSTGHGGNPGLYTVMADGTPVLFSGGYSIPEGFDWATGLGWGGDMFSTDTDLGEIYRVKADGTRTLWATLPGAADVAFCGGKLYIVSRLGKCFIVSSATSVGKVVQTQCTTLSQNPIRVEVDFGVVNLGPIPICSVHLTPVVPEGTELPLCGILDTYDPPGWISSLDEEGGAWWQVDPESEGSCIQKFDNVEPFKVILEDAVFCCYDVEFDGPDGEIFFTDRVCFRCDAPVQTQTQTWGSIKNQYR